MRYDHDHPERWPIPSGTTLGGDPEPMSTERFACVTHTRPPRVRPKPRVCPLAQAMGGKAPCEGGPCPFFCVPGADATCAVEAWSPEAREDPVIAAWYLARREDAARSVGPDDPVAIRLHTLGTPGPGD